ncbi:hypothetical protein [Elstera cyanobacteriorum]|uniref:hypothetical protein n=1 Tax=Elstera cyanobacteriorum TaxID=2022747 RepID=UPI002353CD23|nr:hypothetical protein [Elstera cyanobacteriorum]MCK6444406.1 hypothetical protein [Elstera cyanobacteriorum]
MTDEQKLASEKLRSALVEYINACGHMLDREHPAWNLYYRFLSSEVSDDKIP